MGVPAFFRWLSRKYPSILVHCVEEKPKEVGDETIPVDTSQPNPNDVEFDNLYLDMNGIIHPCTHPENKPAPKNEEEMMVLIFEYIDRIFSVVRPRKVLYMAIDGVAPRAKMNQQRSRRFRASKESVETGQKIKEAREELLQKGAVLPPEKPASEKFDSNCITPGTPFMFRLANNLRFYIHDRLNSDPGWKNIKVILSDANVPGEGEHKIMDYIRRQRAQPDHDPNTAHCLCGADADLIMLGLATHEPNFTIIREEFKPNMDRPCILCGQIGHAIEECQGLPKEKAGAFDHLQPKVGGDDTPFIFLRLNVLKEYLEKELKMDGLPFEYDFERALDDWVFMCFFVGNDFLPHLPSLEIREGAIDRLIKLYKNAVYKTGGYLTDSGSVSLERVQLIMQELGEVEDEIFKRRRDDDVQFRKRNKEKRQRNRGQNNKPRYVPGGKFAPQPLGRGRPGIGAVDNPRQEAYKARTDGMQTLTGDRNQDNLNAAQALKAMVTGGNDPRGEKRKHEDEDSDPEPEDNVKLWEDGFKDRYYEKKFDVEKDDIAFRHTVADHYVRGLCWVLRYYYQGVASWKWYFPYHYAPFASDFINITRLSNDFERNTQPFKPLEQLMGVFPAGSKQHVPETWQNLMTDPRSPIIDFYPINFKIDKNGKKYDWQGVALLPFVDEKRLWKALDTVYPDLTPEELHRNGRGNDRLFVHSSHPVHAMLEALYEGVSKKAIKQGNTEKILVNPENTHGMAGQVFCDEFVVLTGETFPSPIPTIPSVHDNRVISVQYKDPQFDVGFVFKSKVLDNAKPMDRVLKPEDFNKFNRGNNWFRPQMGFQPNSGYRGRRDMGPANRMIMSGASIPPPSNLDNREDRERVRERHGQLHRSQSPGPSYQTLTNQNPHSKSTHLSLGQSVEEGGVVATDGAGDIEEAADNMMGITKVVEITTTRETCRARAVVMGDTIRVGVGEDIREVEGAVTKAAVAGTRQEDIVREVAVINREVEVAVITREVVVAVITREVVVAVITREVVVAVITKGVDTTKGEEDMEIREVPKVNPDMVDPTLHHPGVKDNNQITGTILGVDTPVDEDACVVLERQH